MKDIEIGGLLLQKYYEHRRQGFYLTTPEDFNGQLTKEEVLYVSDQLGQQGLLAWKPLRSLSGLEAGMGQISASGVDVVEGARTPPIAIQFQNITVSDSSNVAICDSNVQTVNIQIDKIMQGIDNSPAAAGEKEEAKSLLQKFPAHPLVSTILGAAVKAMV